MQCTPRRAGHLASALICLLAGLAAAAAAPAQVAAGVMPSLSAEDLNERAVTLPAQLPADKTLVLMAFSREQQADLDTWVAGLGLATGTLPWVETPVIERSNAFVRAMINGGMRRGITDTAMRERTITVFTDPAALRRDMGVPGDGKRVAVMVVQRTGQVLGLASGVYTKDKAAALLLLLDPK